MECRQSARGPAFCPRNQ